MFSSCMCCLAEMSTKFAFNIVFVSMFCLALYFISSSASVSLLRIISLPGCLACVVLYFLAHLISYQVMTRWCTKIVNFCVVFLRCCVLCFMHMKRHRNKSGITKCLKETFKTVHELCMACDYYIILVAQAIQQLVNDILYVECV